MTFRPMLAETCEDLSTLPLPGYLSPKLDGIRCVILNGKAVTRKLKPVPNRFIREYLERYPELEGLDGELMVRGAKNFNEVQSAVMSEDGEPDFVYWVFDKHDVPEGAFSDRYEATRLAVFSHYDNPTLSQSGRALAHERVSVLLHVVATSLAEVQDYVGQHLAEGFEGTMYRHPEGRYKNGRSTLKQAWLLKIKQFKDDEALIVGTVEQFENTNEAEMNELGLSKRSSHLAGMKGKETLGAFVVQWRGVQFNVGTGDGLTHALRKEYWERRDSLIGQALKFKYFELSVDGVPRFPIALAVRDGRDL